MIRLALRLTVTGGREAVTRLVVIAVAVAIGVGLLLTMLAGLRAVDAQNGRFAWLETGFHGSNAQPLTAAHPAASAGVDPLWWSIRLDQVRGRDIGRVDVAPTGPSSPVPPGIPRLPGPGEYYASPALTKLIRELPAAELADRYPGRQVGVIGPAALPSPTSLIVVVGHRVPEMAAQPDAERVDRISTTKPNSIDCSQGCAIGAGYDRQGIILILSVVAVALLFPVLVFVGGATRLSAGLREQRFAAMRLVGATPRQVAVISTVESCVATILGVAAGFVLFFALRPVVARIPVTGDPFYPADLTLGLPEVVAVAVGVPLLAAVAARVALRRVDVSPLGVHQRTTPRPPRAWRVLPLLAGLAELAYLAFVSDIGNRSTDPMVQAYAYLAGIFLVMIGLVASGPWLTMVGSRLVVRLARRPATMIAGRRLADDPTAGFRAVRGPVLAVFIGTCSVAIIGTIGAYNNGSAGDQAVAASTLVMNFGGPPDASTRTPAAGARARAALLATPGVTGVTLVRGMPAFPPRELASCAEVATTPFINPCPRGAAAVEVNVDYGGAVVSPVARRRHPSMPVALTPAQVAALPLDTVVVATDGTQGAVERARTVLEAATPTDFPPMTVGEIRTSGSRQIDGYRRLATVVVLVSLPIAGCSLAVSIVGGLADRRRPFSLLRLTGTPLSMLRRVVLLESVVPLLVTVVVSIAAGLASAGLFLRAQMGERLQLPGSQFSVLVLAGLAVSMALIASTLPFLDRTTGPEVARNG